jgi:SAM-dependent methyltransferase
MEGERLPFAALERLVSSGDIRDRAFAAGVLAVGHHQATPEQVHDLYDHIRGAAARAHEDIRSQIRGRTLEVGAFVDSMRGAPLEVREHLIEEILGVAYPPPDDPTLPREVVRYCPSGLAEILFAIEHGELGPSATFVDLGSGLGKVTLLVALLTGCRAYGIEIDPRLVAHARAAAVALRLDEARFIEGDIRDVPLPPADVYYMYIPLVRSTGVAARLERIAAERGILVFSQALDLEQLAWLSRCDASSYWLEMYTSR